MPSLAHRGKKLPPLVQHPPGLFHRRHHLLDRFEDVLRAEVEAAIKALDRAVNLFIGQARISDRALLIARFVEQRIDREESIPGYVVEQLGAWIRRCERHLDRLAIHLAREPHRFPDRLLVLARKSQDKSPVNQYPQLVAILGEAPRALEADALLDVL